MVESEIVDQFDFPEEANIPIHKKELRMAVFKAFRGRCYYTGRKLSIDHYHIDHIIPRSKGGPDNYYNYVLCDPDLNQRKSDHLNEENLPGILYAVSATFAPKVEKNLGSNQGGRRSANHQRVKLSKRQKQLLELKKETETARRYFEEVIEPGFFKGNLFPKGFHKDYFSQEIEEVKEGKFTIGIGDDIIPTREEAMAVLGYIFEKRKDLDVEILYDYKGDPFADRKKITLTPGEIADISSRIERGISKEKVWDIVKCVLFDCCLWYKYLGETADGIGGFLIKPGKKRMIMTGAEGIRYEKMTYCLSHKYAEFLDRE